MTLANHFEWQVISVEALSVLKSYVKALRHHRQNIFQRNFSECLPEADPSTCVEWYQGEATTLLARWSEIQRALRVKSIRKELKGPLPI